ncbi:catalase [Rickettsiales bacterium LUAb2]
MKNKILTTSSGSPVYEDNTSITTGHPKPRTLIEDSHLIEKLAHFNRERIPERVVHAKGAGAYGYFEVTNNISEYTSANFLSEVGKKTDLFIRFSTVGGEKGSADAERDPRGFAIKLYTEEGNYDIVGNNTPVFFIRDAIKFPDFIHTQKRNPATNTKDPNMVWDFFSLTPESIHQATILFSNRGTPKNYIHMNGYGSHTFMFYKNNGSFVWMKWHFHADAKAKNLKSTEAIQLMGIDPDHATRNLYDSIEKGEFPSWTAYVQIMTDEQAKNYKFDPFDVTKVWYKKDFPLIKVGKIVLNKNPENYFAEVEQATFSPSNFVPGIAASPDKMLQGRLFAYPDAHRYRIGTNHNVVPVNQAKNAKVNTYQRDGFMVIDNNGGNSVNYYPNSFGGVAPDSSYKTPKIDLSGHGARHIVELKDVDFIQAGELYNRVLNNEEKEDLINNIFGSLSKALLRIQKRQCALFYKCHEDYGTRITAKLGLDINEIKQLASMTQEERISATS